MLGDETCTDLGPVLRPTLAFAGLLLPVCPVLLDALDCLEEASQASAEQPFASRPSGAWMHIGLGSGVTAA